MVDRYELICLNVYYEWRRNSLPQRSNVSWFNWKEIDDDLIKREATLAVECGDYDNWDHAYESLWDLWESEDLRDLVLTEPF